MTQTGGKSARLRSSSLSQGPESWITMIPPRKGEEQRQLVTIHCAPAA